MAATPSTMVALGSEAPSFSLWDPTTGAMQSLQQIRGEAGTLVMFICNHCPYVKHMADELASLGKDYAPQGIGLVAISSNDANLYPADSPPKIAEEVIFRGYTFPYLYDETQEVAMAYHAVCTPDFFLYDKDLRLVYRGQLDDSRPGNGVPVTGEHLRAALDALVEGRPVDVMQKPSIGCNIKWKVEA